MRGKEKYLSSTTYAMRASWVRITSIRQYYVYFVMSVNSKCVKSVRLLLIISKESEILIREVCFKLISSVFK